MRNRLASVAACAGLVVAGLMGGTVLQMLGRAAAQAPPSAPPDTAALRAQYDK
jgi:hypothetical protein